MITKIEQRAILKLIDKMVKADGYIDLKEAEYMEELMRILSIDASELTYLDEVTETQALGIVQKMEDKKKKIILKSLIAISESDDVIPGAEAKMLEKIKETIFKA